MSGRYSKPCSLSPSLFLLLSVLDTLCAARKTVCVFRSLLRVNVIGFDVSYFRHMCLTHIPKTHTPNIVYVPILLTQNALTATFYLMFRKKKHFYLVFCTGTSEVNRVSWANCGLILKIKSRKSCLKFFYSQFNVKTSLFLKEIQFHLQRIAKKKRLKLCNSMWKIESKQKPNEISIIIQITSSKCHDNWIKNECWERGSGFVVGSIQHFTQD